LGASRLTPPDEIVALVDLERLDPKRRRERVAAIGEAMCESADLAVLVEHRLIDGLGHGDGAERRIGRGERLGHGDRMGLEPEGLRAEPVPKPSEAGDHLIDDEQNVVFGEHLLHAVEMGLGRHDHAASPHHGLGDEGRDGVRPLALDQGIEIGGEPRGEVLLALARQREAVMMRAVGVQEAVDRNIEIEMIVGKPREARRGDGDAVIGFDARDDLLLLRQPPRIVVIPGELHLAIVGFRSGRGEEHLGGRRRRDRFQLLGELDRLVVALGTKEMGEGEPGKLLAVGLDQLLIAVAERRAP